MQPSTRTDPFYIVYLLRLEGGYYLVVGEIFQDYLEANKKSEFCTLGKFSISAELDY